MEGTCESACSKLMLSKPVNITTTLLHAHFLGRQLIVAQFRKGKWLRDLARNDAFDYNNPTTNIYDPAVDLRPGDVLKTTCVFDSTKRQKTTYMGEGTYDEMCFGFLRYYPKFERKRQNLCLSFER